MKYNDLKKIKKAYFNYQDIARGLSISEASARVMATRYVRQNYLIRLKRNLYLLKEKWNNLSYDEKMEIANLIQVPSYISLLTALSYYEITTQVQQNFIESVSLYRTFRKEINSLTFNYSKIKQLYYFGFGKQKNIFIAMPEKAFIDALYLTYQGRYHIDISAIDSGKIDQKRLDKLMGIYPDKFKTYIQGAMK